MHANLNLIFIIFGGIYINLVDTGGICIHFCIPKNIPMEFTCDKNLNLKWTTRHVPENHTSIISLIISNQINYNLI